MPDETDHALLDRARSGDSRAIETLLERHQGRICIKQRRRSKFAPIQGGSLDTGAANEAAHLTDPKRLPDEALAGKQVEHVLEQAISTLEPTSREVLILRDVEGLTAPEVAEVVGIGVQAVKSRLHRARLLVRAQLEPLLGIPVEPTPAESTCPDVITLFSRHLEGEISAGACAEMEQHMRQCARCRNACDSLGRTLALCHAAGGAVEVPASVQASVKLGLRDFLGGRA